MSIQVPEHLSRQDADDMAARHQLAGIAEVVGGLLLLGGAVVETFDHPGGISIALAFSASALGFRGVRNTSRAKSISEAYQLRAKRIRTYTMVDRDHLEKSAAFHRLMAEKCDRSAKLSKIIAIGSGAMAASGLLVLFESYPIVGVVTTAVGVHLAWDMMDDAATSFHNSVTHNSIAGHYDEWIRRVDSQTTEDLG